MASESNLRFVLDGRCLNDHFPGIGRYLFSLATAITELQGEHELVILCDPAVRNSRFPIGALNRPPAVRLFPVRHGVFSLTSQTAVPAILRHLRAHAYFAPYYVRAFLPGVPTVVMLHDITPLLRLSGLRRRARWGFWFLTKLNGYTANRLITGSAASRRDFARILGGRTGAHIRVVPHGVDGCFRPSEPREQIGVRTKYGLDGDYVLYLGSNKPHKNLSTLVRAWSPSGERTVKLVFAGKLDPRHDDAARLTVSLGIQESVRFLGEVPEADLPALYGAALAFVFPSLYEGFGLPVLEAMACGTPVLCSSTPALVELAGGACLLAEPGDCIAWSEALAEVLSSAGLRAELRERGLRRARLFTWQRSAHRTFEVLVEAASS